MTLMHQDIRKMFTYAFEYVVVNVRACEIADHTLRMRMFSWLHLPSLPSMLLENWRKVTVGLWRPYLVRD